MIRKRESKKPGLIKQTRLNLVLELSWLERYTDNVEVGSSTLPGTTNGIKFGGLAQLARASALHAEGQRFESVILHSIGNVRNEDERSMTYCTSKQ